MSFFNSAEPIIRSKQEALDVQDLEGLLRLHFHIGNLTLFSRFYTRIDQVFVLWGLISAAIFITAQFLPLSWNLQAVLWSVLSLLGTLGMVVLTEYWVKVERLTWLVCCWAILMVGGLVVTDLSIFLGWGEVLIRLCPLWLGLCSLGYFFTGFGLRSRAFFLASLIHLLGIDILPYVGGWQFLATGIIMASSLMVFAEIQWDMRPLIDSDFLTPKQKQFNYKQHQLRQVSVIN